MDKTNTSNLEKAVGIWLTDLREIPGWREWKKTQLGALLAFEWELYKENQPDDFELPEPIKTQHDIVMKYLNIQMTVARLGQCEFYFRRFPFKDFPISRSDHLSNVCELYFSRIHEFRERQKLFLDALGKYSTKHTEDIVSQKRAYRQYFDREIQIRNYIHHEEHYTDYHTDVLFMINAQVMLGREYWNETEIQEYRKIVKIWVSRVRTKVKELEVFIEFMAKTTLEICEFLSSRVPADK